MKTKRWLSITLSPALALLLSIMVLLTSCGARVTLDNSSAGDTSAIYSDTLTASGDAAQSDTNGNVLRPTVTAPASTMELLRGLEQPSAERLLPQNREVQLPVQSPPFLQ